MTREEHKKQIQSLLGMLNPEHQADASVILTNLSEDYEQTLTHSEQLETDKQNLTDRNARLRDVNADLLLKVGVGTTKPDEKEQEKPEINPVSFDSLFNEKGELL